MALVHRALTAAFTLTIDNVLVSQLYSFGNTNLRPQSLRYRPYTELYHMIPRRLHHIAGHLMEKLDYFHVSISNDLAKSDVSAPSTGWTASFLLQYDRNNDATDCDCDSAWLEEVPVVFR